MLPKFPDIKSYIKNPQSASQPKILGRQCDSCGNMTSYSDLRLYTKDLLQYAPFNQEDRVGKMVCPRCLPPINNAPVNNTPDDNTRVASKIDLLFAEIFKSND